MLLLQQPEGLATGSHYTVSFAPARPQSTLAASRPLLRIVVTPVLCAEAGEARFGKLADYLGAACGREPIVLKLGPYSEVDMLMRDERCDVALLCSGPTIRGVEEASVETLALPQIGGRTSYSSLLIASRSVTATSLAQLEGKRYALADMGCLSAWIYPGVCLRTLGFDEEKFFSERVITGSHDRSVRAVASGRVDAASVNSLVYEDMVRSDAGVAATTRVVSRSPPFGSPLLVVNTRLSRQFRELLRATLLAMFQDAGGRAALAEAGIDRFLPPPSDHFAAVEEVLRQWRSR